MTESEQQRCVPATVVRGGTSKGVYFRRDVLPDDRERWDDVLLRTFGSPDPKQVDGIGGSHSTASKAMIVSPSDADGVDVDYLFGQVGIEKPVVDWGGNCGNLTFGVGPFALERGIVDASSGEDDRTEFLLRNENTGTLVEQSIPVDRDGRPRYRGDFTVHGVPGTGARIQSRFLDPGGSVTGSVFPTGERLEALTVEGLGEVEASLVDVASPCVFVRASDVGFSAREAPSEIDADPAALDRLERVRSTACARYGFVDEPRRATAESPGIPKLAMFGERADYETADGSRVASGEYDLLARIMSMQKAHHAYAVTGAMCTAAAAAIPGTIPNEFADGAPGDEIVLGHPKGTMTIGVAVDGESVEHATVDRTARPIMDGDLYYLPRDG